MTVRATGMASTAGAGHCQCFVCKSDSLRTVKLHGKRSERTGVSERIQVLLGEESYGNFGDLESIYVCLPCRNKVDFSYDFITLLRESVRSSVISKCQDTPTPEITCTQTSTCRTRKKLLFENPEELSEPSTPTSQDAATDHGYSAPCLAKDDHTHGKHLVVSQIRERFMDLPLPELLPHRPAPVTKSASAEMYLEIRRQTADLLSKSEQASVLYSCRNLTKLQDTADSLMENIIKEMSERVPSLLNSMLCVAVPASGEVSASLIPAIASAYSVLMKERWNNLSAYHRLSSVIAIRGGLDERAQTRLQHLGLLLSYSSRLRIQEDMQIQWDKTIVEKLKQNPLIKITGDNLDIYVKRSNISTERQNKDLHLFASNLIFSRVASLDMDNSHPKIDSSLLKWREIMMKEQCSEREKLVYCYSILLARILCKMPAFAHLKPLIPDHISHEHSEKMSRKSEICPLPIMFCNETKHDDCMTIMDTYEDHLVTMFSKAFGSTESLRQYGVPVGGDQLTRVRLTEAKTLRSLSVTPEKRYDDLHPIVCEMWHVKQDLLEKCYKRFYGTELSQGTLGFFKTVLHRKDVNGKVKARFQPHFDLLMTVGEGMVTEQFLEFLKMDAPDSQPDNHLLTGMNDQVPDEQFNTMMKMIEQFIRHFGYGSLDNPVPNEVPKILNITKSSNHTVTVTCLKTEKDELMSYSSQLCQWYLHLCELHDTAKEGDLNRTVVNCQYSIPFFYSHSKLSKYLVENIDFVLKCNYLLSPLQRTRVLEGAYVNTKGGKGHNVESDLAQEHSVGNQKALIKTLGANKSEKSISRSTGAADTIAEIISKFDQGVGIKVKSGHHSKAPLSETDTELISTTLRRIRPFRFSPGRKCPGFKNVESVPVTSAQVPAMRERIDQILRRLTHGLHIAVDDEVDDDDDNDDDE